MSTVEMRLFGRPSISIDGIDAHLTPRLLHLTIRLATAVPSGVSAERLVADLWPDSLASEGALRVAVNRLRTVIGARHVRFEHGGYRLVDVDVDLHRFERWVRSARELDGDERLDVLEAALQLGGAPAFEGCRDLAWIQPIAHRTDELRESVVDTWIDALVERGRAERRLPDLIEALERAPARERRCELVALSLYRAGRQADALRAITRTRRMLRDELGIHPGDGLMRLELRILDHDPTLLHERPTDAQLDIEAQVRAAQALIRVGAHDDATRILDDAERAAPPDSRHAGLVALERARVAASSGGHSPRPHIERAQRIARSTRDGALLARAALAFVGLGTPDDKAKVLVTLTEPLALLPPDAPERVDLLCAAASLVTFIDASDTIHRLVAEAERLDASRGDDRSRLVLLVARSLVASLDAETLDRSASDGAAALELAHRIGEPELTTVAIQAMLRAWFRRGDLAAVESILDELEETSRLGSMPYGLVRTHLCRATIAAARGDLVAAERHGQRARHVGTRLDTSAIDGAARTIDAVIAIEHDRRADLRELALSIEACRGPSAWAALAAWAGDDPTAARLATIGPALPRDDAFSVFVALAAEVAYHRGDAHLGVWCRGELEPLAGRTILVGLGTAVLGFADHFIGLAAAASGDLGGASDALERSRQASKAVGAGLWWAHSTVELAEVRLRAGDVDTAERLLAASSDGATTPRLEARIAALRSAFPTVDGSLTG